jgi:uncharacterized membrane protein (UPF0182 family)
MAAERPGRPRILWIALALFLLLIFSRSLCGLFLDYLWWGEMGQVSTWIRMAEYRYLPPLGAWLLLWIVLWMAHARGMKYAGTGLGEYPRYGRLATLALGFLALIVALSSVDGWTVARYAGGRGVASNWQDPVFAKPLSFYFFELPFYNQLVVFLLVAAAAAALVYYAAARAWQVRRRFPGLWQSGQVEWDDLKLLGRLETGMLQVLVALFLAGIAAMFWLGRYGLLYSDHGNLMVGLNYVDQNLRLPLQTAKAVAALLAAALVLIKRRRLALLTAVVLVADIVVPPLVGALYVRPNELVNEKPYLQRHIEATRHAFGIDGRTREVAFPAKRESPINIAANKPLLDNVRLWDWRPFHDTISQTQPLRPYVYSDADADRYHIGGRLQQVLLAPRDLDLNQLGEAGRSWINATLTFTHGYGLVLAEANKITADGLPELLIKDAPVRVLTPDLKVTQPELYYGEASHEPVFVRTKQEEFNYPAGSEDVSVMYAGRGGFPIAGTLTKLAATIALGDGNIVLSSALTSESRMMIRRRVPERLRELASFLHWDQDPYLVITDAGHLVWIVDGYTTTDAHPYARGVRMENLGSFNYIRNSVKATVDAYHGEVKLYVFDEEDPLIQAWRRLLPDLFRPASEMPADLRAHTRAPEDLFSAQAEMYRVYHMRDPESYYNRADQWDLATYTTAQGARPQPIPPSHIVAILPGEREPEFLLSLPFTPRGKQNLIGMMLARNDGEHLGEVVFLQLPKQEIIPGPQQIEALINQDQVISKDLSLWNTQGSQVLRSQIRPLPIDNTFLFVAPIYIQAAEARMPQLRKVVLAVGNTLVYADTYEEALKNLAAAQRGLPAGAVSQTGSAPPATPAEAAAVPPGEDRRIQEIRTRLERYRSLSAQGKWAEAGKELEAVEAAVRR